MYIIVVGAGEVGSYVAERLGREGHEVALIEKSAGRHKQVADTLDVLTIRGSGTSPADMEMAGVDKADLVVAVTSVDEVNIVSSMLAKNYGVAKTVVRIEAADLRQRKGEQFIKGTGADLIIDPDEETAEEIKELLEYPGASEVAVMAGGEVIVLGTRLPEHAPLVGRSLHEVASDYEPEFDFLFGAISRDGETIIPRGNEVLQANDLLRVVCKRESRRELARLVGLARDIPKRVLLAGGGRTAEILAETLSDRGASVVIVERDVERAEELAAHLDRVVVLNGDITDSTILDEGEVEHADAVIALTGEDDANILACLYAKSQGAKETIAVAHRLSLLPLLSDAGVDVALSPRTATANSVLKYVRGGVAAVATFLEGEAEVLEFELPRDSPAEGQRVCDLDLPKDVLIGAIVRDGKARIARGRSTLRTRDHIVLFAMPSSVDAARRIFG